MSKKKKFDLTALVHQGYLKEGDTLTFVSDNRKMGTLKKLPNGEYKVATDAGVVTVHAFAQACLGAEPPEHASRWFKSPSGKTLYELWHADDEDYSMAA